MNVNTTIQVLIPVQIVQRERAPAPDRRERAGTADFRGQDAPTRRGAPPPRLNLAAITETQNRARRQKSGADNPLDLSEEEQAQVRELKKVDREVRQHEQAHKAAGGPFVGGVSYTFEQGPDGQRYAVAGSVPIDTAPVDGDPEATIAKMEVVKRAALAPTKPSGQDQAVASAADQTRVQAQAELNRERDDELSGEDDETATGPLGFFNAASHYDRASQLTATQQPAGVMPFRPDALDIVEIFA